jgi:hypothetical protein
VYYTHHIKHYTVTHTLQVPSRVVGVVNYMLNVWNKDLNSCTHS